MTTGDWGQCSNCGREGTVTDDLRAADARCFSCRRQGAPAGESKHPQFCVCAKCSSAVAMEHAKGDEKLGRDWRKGEGCACAACRLTRKTFDEIDAGFARVKAAEKALADYRARRGAVA